MDKAFLTRVERLNYALGAAFVVASLFLGTAAHALGVLVGVVITCANFTLMRRVVGRLLDPESTSQRPALLLAPKLFLLMGAVALAIYLLPISPIALAIGFSVFIVSIMVESIRFITKQSLTH